MGICTSESYSKYNCNHVNFNGEMKDVTRDYLLEESIKEPLNKKYKIIDFCNSRILKRDGLVIQRIRGSEMYMSPVMFKE